MAKNDILDFEVGKLVATGSYEFLFVYADILHDCMCENEAVMWCTDATASYQSVLNSFYFLSLCQRTNSFPCSAAKAKYDFIMFSVIL